MDEGFHTPVEEYLETIHSLLEEGVPVIQARIAERMGRSAPSVSEMLDRLEDGGYLYRKGRLIQLTPSGQALAEKVVRKHRLAERLLADVIGLEWHKVHQEAGRWEHVISDAVEARLVVLLGDPATCPHGNPIPGAGTAAPTDGQRPLTDIPLGDAVRLERVAEDVEVDLPWMTYLDTHGFTPGASATVSSRAPDGTVVLEVGASTVALGPDLSRRLFVAPV